MKSAAPRQYHAAPSIYEMPPIEMSNETYDAPPIEQTSSLYELPPVEIVYSEKFKRLHEELISSEKRYLSDLILARKLFYRNLRSVVAEERLAKVFLNWDQLITVSKRIYTVLTQGQAPGTVFSTEIDSLSAFVHFCSRQQSAFDELSSIASDAKSRSLYAQCCADPNAKGMSLHYFLLLPLGRVTRYPLLIEKMLKECDQSNYAVYQSLDCALQLLRALVAEVNLAVSEVDNVSLLCWAQSHIKVNSLPQPLEFAAPTRNLGPRSFLHSGVLYKQTSNRLLVAILFSDFLILTTPDESISSPESFKINKTSDMTFTLYKQPIFISKLEIENSKEEEGLNLRLNSGGTVTALRCVSSNSRRLWMSQIQQAIDSCTIAIAEARNTIVQNSPIGRLLVEIMSTRAIEQKSLGIGPFCIHTTLGPSSMSFDYDLSRPTFPLTTQFPFINTKGYFTIGIYRKGLYSPDQLLLEEAKVPLGELLNESSRHRGPLSKPLPLRTMTDKKKSPQQIETVVVRFVVQLFESQL